VVNYVGSRDAALEIVGKSNPSDDAAWPSRRHSSALGGRIAFVHIRDVSGTAEDFVELFHDEGSVDQLSLFRLYRELGLKVPFSCDHVPTMEGEGNEPGFVPGYGTLERLFANGYLKGLLQAAGDTAIHA